MVRVTYADVFRAGGQKIGQRLFLFKDDRHGARQEFQDKILTLDLSYALQHLHARDRDGQRLGGRAILHLKDPLDGPRVSGQGPDAIHGLGGISDNAAFLDDLGGMVDVIADGHDSLI